MVHRVVDHGESLNTLLSDGLAMLDDPRQRGLAQELAFGALRWFYRLDAVLAALLSRPLRRKDGDVRATLLVGLYQLMILETPAHAAVSESVEAVRQTGKVWAVKLVNGVLRNAQRRMPELLDSVSNDAVARWSYPAWWIRRVEHDLPEHWQQVLEAGNMRPPMVLRVNRRRVDRQQYLNDLRDAGFEAKALGATQAAVQLATPVGVEQLPGFRDGVVSVQDAAAQLCAEQLQVQTGQSVLDACAAPGGKTGHILELIPGLKRLVAIDSSPLRLDRVRQNLERLRLSAQLRVADAGIPAQWWDGQPFDRILLDAPCSASGVVRRHPDIKLLRRDTDVSALSLQQQRLLDALWPLLAPGGILLYVTCSIFAQENAEVVSAFLARCADARELPLDVDWGIPRSPGRQILPGEQDMDGFYFARLTKVSTTIQ
ncbi:MAG: 16S rRNA (cytosine(967)-C(5))-methyltransferase RsmB [Thiogranum sp.]|nr:16S rRNA (cytosine(967)-C(5))-methyltransferase RsmB [Thiogranum sp.]